MTDVHAQNATRHGAAGAMIEGRARVFSVSESDVWLEAEARSACGSCGAVKSCGVSSLTKVLGRRPVRFSLPNDFGARTGEWVVIGIPQSVLLRTSILAYMLPILGLICFAAGASAMGAGDAGSAIAGAAGLALGLALARPLGRRTIALSDMRPVYLRRSDPDDACASGTDSRS
ncbi:MAG: SoxR reducing system RseC family protein [Rhodospirillales bacterium]|nr:SoxR reducing system RseC family protein [Rhodospirillales bacterium]MCW8860989.1 SoxR reducing system RseC family protein [Rhodospirillales bacterium]MCW8971444.1 SoxR reducing system RseC family protein [Rhodospirillales bacterium]MCW9001620.1 SoxR reducing system RseC family protein [Rhodospirillales bacterium]